MIPKDYAKTRRKWRRWIGKLTQQSSALCDTDLIFRQAMAGFVHSKRVPPANQVYQHMLHWYFVTACVAIRRLLDSHRDHKGYSLKDLLEKIETNPQIVTRHVFRSLQRQHLPTEVSDAEFTSLVGANSPSISAVRVRRDIVQLDRISSRIKRVVNRRIAHWERKKQVPAVTFQEVHTAIHEIRAMCRRYQWLLTGSYDFSDTGMDHADVEADCKQFWG